VTFSAYLGPPGIAGDHLGPSCTARLSPVALGSRSTALTSQSPRAASGSRSLGSLGGSYVLVALGLFEASWISQSFSTPSILFLVSDLSEFLGTFDPLFGLGSLWFSLGSLESRWQVLVIFLSALISVSLDLLGSFYFLAFFLVFLAHLAISILFGFDYLVARLIMLLLGWLGLFTYFGDSTTYLFCYMFLTWMAHQYLSTKLKKLKGSNYLSLSRVVRVFLKGRDMILLLFKTFGCIRRLSSCNIKQCTYCGRHKYYVDGDTSSYIPVDQVLISKTEYDSLLQSAHSSSLIASSNTCLHSSSGPSWVIDSRTFNYMTGNSSLLSHISSTCSLSFVTVANGTKTPVQGKGAVTTFDLTLSDVLYLPHFPFNLLSVHKLTLALTCFVTFYPSHCEFQDLKTKMMIGGGSVKDGLYYFQPSPTSVPFTLHSINSPYL
jgi:hypothetical protein